MKKLILGAFLAAFFLAFFSCTSNKPLEGVLTYSAFPQEKKLTAQTLEIDTVLFRYPYRIRVMGDKVIVMDLHGVDHFCHVLHYPDFHYLGSLGKRGEAPEEMLSMENIRCYKDTLWTLDANKKELTGYGLNTSISGVLPRQKVIKLSEDIARPLDFIIYNDTTFIIPDYLGEARFCWVNREGKLIQRSGEIPSQDEEALENSRPALAQAWRSFLDYHPENGVLVAATQLGEVFEIYNLHDNTHLVCQGEHGEPKFQVAGGYGIPTGIMGFSDVQVTDNAIYVVFDGKTFKDIARTQGTLPQGGQAIYVFSLKGEPVCKYTLDRYIESIWVDEVGKSILATDCNSDQPIALFHFE